MSPWKAQFPRAVMFQARAAKPLYGATAGPCMEGSAGLSEADCARAQCNTRLLRPHSEAKKESPVSLSGSNPAASSHTGSKILGIICSPGHGCQSPNEEYSGQATNVSPGCPFLPPRFCRPTEVIDFRSFLYHKDLNVSCATQGHLALTLAAVCSFC